jgi:hypothetical protein
LEGGRGIEGEEAGKGEDVEGGGGLKEDLIEGEGIGGRERGVVC